MTERISTPVSTSPSRVAAVISRPTWPWQPSSSSSNSSLDYRQGSSSPRPTSRVINPIVAHSMWQTTNSRLSATPATGIAVRNFPGDSTKQWSFVGFEWLVRGVHKLRDLVEGTIEIENPDFEILKQSPMLGDNKFKLEIAFTPTREGSSDNSLKPTLSLYITSLMVDFAQSDYELSASMMAAIKCQEDRPGQRGAPPEWLWDFWQTNWVFRQGNEVWECPLPPLSTLLENARIAETDSLVICVQIHCPTGPNFPQQPSVYSVPRDLLEALEASLDNANTGDVRFICLERQHAERTSSPSLPSLDSSTPSTFRPLSQTSSYSPSPVRITARKRVIYAHSDILTRRSEYFASMLASSFSENITPAAGDRKIYTIVVEEADFETIYWLLKFCYANWLLFREDDDPRIVMEGLGAGWSSKWSSLRGTEWDWKIFQKDDNDARSVGSGDSRLSGGESKTSTSRTEALRGPNGTSPNSGSITSTVKPSMMSNNPPSPASRRTTTAPSSTALSPNNSSSLPRPKSITVPLPTATYIPSSRQVYPLSPHTGRHPSSSSLPDPHPHPTPPPRPASALAMYQLAHRYGMPGLVNLALEHMMSTLTPQTCFALLLATSVWEELHLLIEDYVVEKWDEVSVSEEFEQCCQEVAAGEWGADGGRTLTSIFRRLRAPN